MPKHKITIRPDHRGNGRYTYSYLCSCGAHNFGRQTPAAAKAEADEHLQREAER